MGVDPQPALIIKSAGGRRSDGTVHQIGFFKTPLECDSCFCRWLGQWRHRLVDRDTAGCHRPAEPDIRHQCIVEVPGRQLGGERPAGSRRDAFGCLHRSKFISRSHGHEAAVPYDADAVVGELADRRFVQIRQLGGVTGRPDRPCVKHPRQGHVVDKKGFAGNDIDHTLGDDWSADPHVCAGVLDGYCLIDRNTERAIGGQRPVGDLVFVPGTVNHAILDPQL